jgi:hypothetical protein
VKLPSNFMGLFGAPWGGNLAARHGARSAATLGSFLIVLGWCGLTLWHDAVWVLVLWAMVTSLGGAMMMSAVPNLLVEVVPAERTSEFVGPVAGRAHPRHGHRHPGSRACCWRRSSCEAMRRPPAVFPASGAYLLTMAAITAVAAACWLTAVALPRPGTLPTESSTPYRRPFAHEKSRHCFTPAHRRRRFRRQPAPAAGPPAGVHHPEGARRAQRHRPGARSTTS